MRPLNVIQAAVQESLEQDVPEPVQGQTLATQTPDALGRNQAVLPVQLAAQTPYHLLLWTRLYSGHHLGGECLALHAGHGQRPA